MKTNANKYLAVIADSHMPFIIQYVVIVYLNTLLRYKKNMKSLQSTVANYTDSTTRSFKALPSYGDANIYK